MAFGIPPAYMGFVGFVRFTGGEFINASTTIRATTANINLTQEITKPEVIDSRFDRTVYQLGPKLIDGTLVFPAIMDLQGSGNIVSQLYRHAVERTSGDGLLHPITELQIKYASTDIGSQEATFLYRENIVNTWQFSVTQSDIVNISVDFIGLDRVKGTFDQPPAAEMQNTRIVTWNDARVELRINEGRTTTTTTTIPGRFIRSFEANINNNAERYYTLNRVLFPQAIAPTKRDITGNVVLMGRHPSLAEVALDNEAFCSELSSIAFGFVASTSSCGGTFNTILPNVIFQIEEMELTNDLFETTVQWHSLPAAGTGIADPLQDNLNTATFEANA